MINNVTAVTNIGYAGLWDACIKRMNRVGEEGAKITEDSRVQRALEEERKKVQRIYDLQRKIVQPDDEGRHVDIIIRFYRELEEKEVEQLEEEPTVVTDYGKGMYVNFFA